MRRYLMALLIWVSLPATWGWAQDPLNLVTSHHTQASASGDTQIDFTLRHIPQKALLAFEVRFEPRFV